MKSLHNVEFVANRKLYIITSCIINVLLFVASMVLFVSDIIAQSTMPTCVGSIESRPPYTEPPNWWDPLTSTSQPSYAHNVDDPRWNGSSLITYGSGASTPNAYFRFGHDSTYLYLSWKSFKINGTSNINQVFFGYEPSDGSDEKIIQVRLQANTQSSATQSSFPDFFELDVNGKRKSLNSKPTWFTQTVREWINSDGPGRAVPNTFVIQLRIPLNEIKIDPASKQFKIWYQILAEHVGSAAAYNWPPGNSASIVASGIGNKYPKSSSWGSFKLDSSGCSSNGVSLEWYDIGTKNNPSSIIKYSTNSSVSKPLNTIYARIKNGPTEIPSGQLKARFRIANWGSQPGWDWEAGVNANDLWTDIANAGAVQNKVLITADSPPANVTNELSFDWTLTEAEAKNFSSSCGNNCRRPHQCILVELSDVIGLTYKNSSAYRNMDFVGASTFKRDAEISIGGITPIAPNGRDVYLYVETINMPAIINSAQNAGGASTSIAADTILNREQMPTPEKLQQLLISGAITQGQLENVVPSYRVRVFHDTGDRLRIDGNIVPILNSQTTFGYYVSHQGPLIGWKHSLSSKDVILEQLAPNYYRVRNVPNNGKFTVQTIIEAVEPKSSNQKRTSIGIQLGTNIPHGSFDAVYDPGFYLAGAVEYSVKENFSLEGLFGFNRFTGGSLCLKGVPGCTQSIRAADLNLYNVSLNGKYYLTKARTRPFINFGGGLYKFDPGPTRVGGNVGIGFQQSISPRFAVEGGYNIHNVATPFSATRFSTIHFGIRVRP